MLMSSEEVRVPLWVKRGTLRFPEEKDTPVIMVGPGTGVAPFRSAVQERVSHGRHGKFSLPGSQSLAKPVLFWLGSSAKAQLWPSSFPFAYLVLALLDLAKIALVSAPLLFFPSLAQPSSARLS